MILPFKDDNPTHRPSIVNLILIAICVVVFIVQIGWEGGRMASHFGFIPNAVLGNQPSDMTDYLSLFTSLFLHGGLMHLAGNMLFLWIFGDNVEDAMGHTRFLAFYLICGLLSLFTHAMVEPHSTIPVIGASGAISGVMGAYFLLYPKANISVFLLFFVFFKTVRIPAAVVIGIWFLMQLLGAYTAAANQPGIAFWAHIGGFVGGMALVKFFIRKEEHLFHTPRSMPWEVHNRRKGPRQ